MIIPNKQIADFLNSKIVENNFIFLNLWSIIHFFSGFFIIKYVLYNSKNQLIYLFILLGIYELVELLVIKSGSNFFRPEKFIDIAWDLIIGMIGGYVYLKWLL